MLFYFCISYLLHILNVHIKLVLRVLDSFGFIVTWDNLSLTQCIVFVLRASVGFPSYYITILAGRVLSRALESFGSFYHDRPAQIPDR